ncbi:MAG TPA: 2Fe-2S iron-sulfur cluster binding domain-containing protein [Baekduia sp.]|uniref:2Fe-2S iron-sulfur cluster binding domain-containing protein n=1 Tax=Baekduia sp. TaxID=2600305 RepID=UPI002C2CD0B2|nr:2Fe-2S iron-sulfur cluster binding domain-containing protein [Baekduia sp.]HMJ32663.1 2Fe-2S iron-sulfur cluster binding domain-containing protein [Baekduia sp.]
MGEKHIARLEPVGIEMEVDEDETILDAAFRQGLMLMHGCKEGQCAACKSFLLDGEVDLDRYSTFALPDFEESEGYTLLCRAHAMSDVEIELINFDEEIIRSGVPIVTATAEVEAVEELTHDIRRLVLKLPEPLVFNAGQYVDIHIPGVDGEHRSFSMANTPGQPDRLEFMIKLYEGGHFSGLLANGHGIKVGDELTCTGPYGVFTLRDSSPRRLVFIAGGAGMAPIVSLLRSMVEKGTTRPATFYYGARTQDDLFALEELQRLGGELPQLRFVPALSEADGSGWDGESGLITDVVDRLEGDLTEVDAYLCGPPPMVDAAIALLERRGCPESRIYFDKFTTTADD